MATSDPFPGGEGLDLIWVADFSQWVAVGNDGSDVVTVATSPDGNCWTPQVSPEGVDFGEGIAYSPDFGIYLGAFGSFGTVVATSNDGAVTWNVRTTPMDGGEATCAVWAEGLGLWVVGGQSLPGDAISIITSPVGVTWTAQSTPNDGSIFGGVQSLCWSPDLGLLVASGGGDVSGPGGVITSPDGVTWTLQTTPNDGTGNTANGIAWSPALGLFVSVWTTGATTLSSPDGVTWTAGTPLPGSGFTAGRNICWSPDLGLFVMVGQNFETSSSGNIAYSADGVNWTVVSPIVGGTMAGVAWSSDQGQFVAVGVGDVIQLSPDGIVWTLATCEAPVATYPVFENHFRAGSLASDGGPLDA